MTRDNTQQLENAFEVYLHGWVLSPPSSLHHPSAVVFLPFSTDSLHLIPAVLSTPVLLSGLLNYLR